MTLSFLLTLDQSDSYLVLTMVSLETQELVILVLACLKTCCVKLLPGHFFGFFDYKTELEK